jgi:hypothetical protein
MELSCELMELTVELTELRVPDMLDSVPLMELRSEPTVLRSLLMVPRLLDTPDSVELMELTVELTELNVELTELSCELSEPSVLFMLVR